MSKGTHSYPKRKRVNLILRFVLRRYSASRLFFSEFICEIGEFLRYLLFSVFLARRQHDGSRLMSFIIFSFAISLIPPNFHPLLFKNASRAVWAQPFLSGRPLHFTWVLLRGAMYLVRYT